MTKMNQKNLKFITASLDNSRSANDNVIAFDRLNMWNPF